MRSEGVLIGGHAGRMSQESHEHVDVARRWIDACERADVSAAKAVSGLGGWDPGPWVAEAWRPRVEELAGSDRTVGSARQVNERMVRVVLDGDRGQAYVSVVLDEDAKVVGTSVDSDEQDGRFWVVVGCPEEREDELRAFYTMLTDGRVGPGEGRMRPHAGATRRTPRRSTSTCSSPTWM
jgi:hypothetical protein